MPKGRPRKPLEELAPRHSGASPAPTPEEAERQRQRLLVLARDVGEERWRRGEAPRAPATWAELGAVLGMGPGHLWRASLLPPHKEARRVRLATLDLWERRARAWIAGEDVLTEE